MRVRNIRLPWGQGNTARTVGYLDDAQFGGLARKVGGHDIQNMKNFFLGVGFGHPKLVVARMTANDFHSRTDLAKKFFAQFKGKFKSSTGVVSNPALDEDDERFLTYAQRMARYKAGGTRAGAREAKPVRGPEQMYRPHLPQEQFNTAWSIIDPTRPGRQVVPKDRAIRLAKKVLEPRFANVLFADTRQKIMTKDVAVILGVGYVLQYWQTGQPRHDVRWLESVQARVRKHLAGEKKPGSARLDPTNTWYAMGKHEMPVLSQRFQPTKQGRVKRYQTFRKGVGLAPTKPSEQFRLRPLFTVKARNIIAAKEAAERKIEKMIRNPNTAEQGYDFHAAWHGANRRMVSLAAIRMLKKQ
jgi:hypothetical protein